MKYLFISLVSSATLTAKSSLQKQIDDILLYQEQKNIYQDNLQKLQEKKFPYASLRPYELEKSAGGRCIKIDTIKFENISLISENTLERLKKPYLHKCNTIADLKNLVKKVNNIYIKNAYITSRAYIKPQDLNSGVFVISAIEGKIEDIKDENVNTKLIFFSPQNKPLNLRYLETGIEQLNRLESFKTTMSVNPSKQVGYSVITMHREQISHPYHFDIGVNNYGSVKSGKYQWSASLSYEDPLNLNDKITIGYNSTSKQDKENKSRGLNISYAIPIAKDYIKFTYSQFRYKQIVNGLNKDYLSSGKSKSYKIEIEHKLFHNTTQRGTVNYSLERKRNDNYLEGVYLDTSSSKLTIFKLSYTHKITHKKFQGYATLTYHQGLPWFGAKAPTNTSPKFKKLTLDISATKNFYPKSFVPITYNFSFHGQYARKNILGSEQIGVGGIYSVRGFKNSGQLSGNIGFYARNELSFLFQKKWGSITPYIALDFGVVKHNENSYGGRIVGGALGVRTKIKGFSLEMFYTKALSDSNKNKKSKVDDEIKKHSQNFFGLNLSYHY